MDDATFREIARIYGITPAELSANPKEREKARGMDRLLDAVRDLDAEGIALIAGYAERIRPPR